MWFANVLRWMVYMTLFWGIYSQINNAGAQQVYSTTSDPDDISHTVPYLPDNKQEAFLYPEGKAALWIDKNALGIIIVVLGVCGNIMCIILLRRPRLRNSATSFYMTALAISDTVVLVFGVAGNHTLRTHSVPIQWHIYCKIMYFLVKWCMAASDWILACMSVERCLAVTMPLRSKSILNPKANKICLFAVVLCVGAYYSHAFIVYGSVRGICSMNSLIFNPNTRALIDYTVFILCPALMIAVSNILIIICLIRSGRKKAHLSEGQAVDIAKAAANSSLIAMLISISVAFFLFKTPWYIMKTAVDATWTARFGYQFATQKEASYRLVLCIFLLMLYCNNCINFFLYILSGKEFRHELVDMVKGLFKSQKYTADVDDSGITHVSSVTDAKYVTN